MTGDAPASVSTRARAFRTRTATVSPFDWLPDLLAWTPLPDGREWIELPRAEVRRRCGLAERDWAFVFVSWASARLIRTGEWYEIAPCDEGAAVVRIVRELQPAA